MRLFLRNGTQLSRNFSRHFSRLLARLSLILINFSRRFSKDKWRNLDSRVFIATTLRKAKSEGGHRKESSKLRMPGVLFLCLPSSISPSLLLVRRAMQISFREHILKTYASKGLAAFALIGTVSLIGKRTQCERVKSRCLRESPSRAMHVKRRIIRSLMPDYHALSWCTCRRKRASEAK